MDEKKEPIEDRPNCTLCGKNDNVECRGFKMRANALLWKCWNCRYNFETEMKKPSNS